MKVLISDPPQKEEHYDLSYPNLGILYVISNLRKHYPDIEIKYLEGQCDLKTHVDEVLNFKPDLYCISFAMWTSSLCYKTINEVKKHLGNVPILCGGAHPTSAYEEVLTQSEADYCCLGEGERAIVDIVEFIINGKPKLDEIPGIAFKKDGEIIVTKKRDLVKNLDDISMPAWDIVNFKKYSGMHIRKREPQTYISVSRGCPFDCNFCSNPVWKLNKPWVRVRSAENIADEVEYLYGKGIREIYLSADEFNVNEKWTLKVSDAIRELKHDDMYFQCNIRADIINEKIAKNFRKMNLWMAHIGIESGNQQTLEGIGKKISIEQIENACAVLKNEGIKIFGFVMLYHAWEKDGKLVYETPEQVDNTLKFCRKLLSKKLIDYMSWQVATPMRGSRLWDIAVRHNLLPGKFASTVWDQNMLLPNISKHDVKRSLRKGMILKNFYLIKNGNISIKHWSRALKNLKVIFGR